MMKAVEDGEYGNSRNHSTIIEVTFCHTLPLTSLSYLNNILIQLDSSR